MAGLVLRRLCNRENIVNDLKIPRERGEIRWLGLESDVEGRCQHYIRAAGKRVACQPRTMDSEEFNFNVSSQCHVAHVAMAASANLWDLTVPLDKQLKQVHTSKGEEKCGKHCPGALLL